jgi:hypothetical protein
VGVIAFVLYRYARDHPELWNALMTFGPIRALYNFFIALLRRLSGWADAVRERLPRRSAKPGKREASASSRFRWPRPRTPRERLLYYYLTALRRAGKEGYPRRAPQTPREYGEYLKPKLPEAHREVDALTQAFVEARYSRHPIEPDRVGRVRTVWQRVMEALRALRRHK